MNQIDSDASGCGRKPPSQPKVCKGRFEIRTRAFCIDKLTTRGLAGRINFGEVKQEWKRSDQSQRGEFGGSERRLTFPGTDGHRLAATSPWVAFPNVSEPATLVSERLRSVSQPATIPSERLLSVLGSATIPSERLPSVSEPATIPSERLPSVSGSATIPSERLPSVSGSATIPSERLPSVSESATIPSERLPSVSGAATSVPDSSRNVPKCPETV